MTDCLECAGTGFCSGCKGDGLVLQAFAIDVCQECRGYGQVRDGERRIWCPGCGGSGKHLMYEELVACDDCIGDVASCICPQEGGITVAGRVMS